MPQSQVEQRPSRVGGFDPLCPEHVGASGEPFAHRSTLGGSQRGFELGPLRFHQRLRLGALVCLGGQDRAPFGLGQRPIECRSGRRAIGIWRNGELPDDVCQERAMRRAERG